MDSKDFKLEAGIWGECLGTCRLLDNEFLLKNIISIDLLLLSVLDYFIVRSSYSLLLLKFRVDLILATKLIESGLIRYHSSPSHPHCKQRCKIMKGALGPI